MIRIETRAYHVFVRHRHACRQTVPTGHHLPRFFRGEHDNVAFLEEFTVMPEPTSRRDFNCELMIFPGHDQAAELVTVAARQALTRLGMTSGADCIIRKR